MLKCLSSYINVLSERVWLYSCKTNLEGLGDLQHNVLDSIFPSHPPTGSQGFISDKLLSNSK